MKMSLINLNKIKRIVHSQGIFSRAFKVKRIPREERTLALQKRGCPWRAAVKLAKFSSVESFEVPVASVAPFVYSRDAKAQRTLCVQCGSDIYVSQSGIELGHAAV